MKSMFFIPLVFILFGTIACSTSKSSSKTSLSPKEFKEGFEKNKNAILLDVRTPEEFNKEQISNNAINLNWNDTSFKSEVKKYKKTQAIYVYCLSGGRSGAAANYLRENGYKEVYELQGGIMNWRTAGYPLIPGSVSVNNTSPNTNMTIDEYEHLTNDPNQLVLVDFNAPWCGPCKMMKPFLLEIQNEYNGKVKLIMINVDDNPELAESLKVKGLPTLKLYKGNSLVWNQLGYLNKEAIESELQKHL